LVTELMVKKREKRCFFKLYIWKMKLKRVINTKSIVQRHKNYIKNSLTAISKISFENSYKRALKRFVAPVLL
jgi:hypothetical protein